MKPPSKITPPDDSEVIRTSKDYDRFVPHGLQRIIKPGHVKKIMASMKQHGFMPSHPIAVMRDADKFRIIDGHHRHAAAKSLGIPLAFVMLSKAYEGAVGDANTGKAWTTVEWARKYTLEGYKDYLTLNRYVVSGIPLNLAAAMLTGNSAGSSGNTLRQIISGEFTVKTTEQADAILSFIKDFKGVCQPVSTQNFIKAFSLCYQVDKFDPEELRRKLNANPKLLTKTADHHQMLEQIEDIYNLRSRERIPLAFLAKEAASNRSAFKKKPESK